MSQIANDNCRLAERRGEEVLSRSPFLTRPFISASPRAYVNGAQTSLQRLCHCTPCLNLRAAMHNAPRGSGPDVLPRMPLRGQLAVGGDQAISLMCFVFVWRCQALDATPHPRTLSLTGPLALHHRGARAVARLLFPAWYKRY